MAKIAMSAERAGRTERSRLAQEVKDTTIARRNEVHSMMEKMKAASKERHGEITALVSRFHRDREAFAAAHRRWATAFVRDLTNSIASLLDQFDKENRDRAAAIGARLAGYAADRDEAVSIWRGARRLAR